MAVLNQIDPEETRRQLETWLSEKLDQAEAVEVSNVDVPASSGFSYLTILFDASWRSRGDQYSQRYALRLQPPSGGVFPKYDLPGEFAVMRAVDVHTTVPVAHAHWIETDPAVLGAPFMVMDRVDGRVPRDDPPYTHTGWVLDLSAEGQARLYDQALCVLARLAGADVSTLGLDELGAVGPDGQVDKHSPGLENQLAYYEYLYEWTGRPHPTLEAGLQWARENGPTDEPLALSWGDARIGNMMFAEDLSVAAVLDWELAVIASREQDLGWWQVMLEMYSAGVGAPSPAGFPDRAATIARFEEISGHTVKHLDYYETFAALRAAICVGCVGALMIEHGFLPPDSPMPIANPASNILASRLGLPAPATIITDWVGKR